LLVNWDKSIDVGFNGASGPSNNTNFRSGIRAHYEDDLDRWDLKSVYLYKQDENETTDNKYRVDLLKDWFLADSSRLYFTCRIRLG